MTAESQLTNSAGTLDATDLSLKQPGEELLTDQTYDGLRQHVIGLWRDSPHPGCTGLKEKSGGKESAPCWHIRGPSPSTWISLLQRAIAFLWLYRLAVTNNQL